MSTSIVSLLPNSQYTDLKEFIEDRQSVYPSDWFYKPIGMEIEITNKCNLKCAGCGQRDEFQRPEDILDTKDYINIINQAKEFGISACSITGGETFLYLEKIKLIISSLKGIDIFKINTNGYRFVNNDITVKILKEFKKCGFDKKNKYIKPVFVVSIGQQNENGMPLINSVNLVNNFYKVFDPNDALCTINVTDRNVQIAMSWVTKFKHLYKKVTGKALDTELIPIRTFMLNNIPTLERLGLINEKKVPIRELLYSYKNIYKSWKCLNLPPEDINELTTLIPKCVLRPNGDLYSCPGYNYVHKIGSLRKQSLKTILENTNHNPILKAVFTKGLLGLLDYAKKFNPGLEEKLLSISYAPCDVCQLLSHEIKKYTYV